MHNNVRDVFLKMAQNAGVQARTDVPLILPGSHEKPGDIVMDGIGLGSGDLVVDVTVVDSVADLDGASQGDVRKRTLKVGVQAAAAEKFKREKKGGPRNDTMEDRVRRVGKEFFPVGFETTGASTSQSSSLIKKLSDLGLQRRGHHPAYFILRWRATLAMALAKKGCEVALTRAYVVRQQQRGQLGIVERDGDPGPLLDVNADVFIHDGFA